MIQSMRSLGQSVLWLFAAAFILVLYSSAYVLPEGQQALITQFGKIQGEPIDKAGLHFKVPFLQDVRYFDKRILNWDGDEEQIPTKDKKYIWVDATARWRITEVRKFAETVQSEAGARDRLDGILDGVTRDTISNHNLVEAVRNSNQIFEAIGKKSEAQAAENESLEALKKVEEEITGDIERIQHGREKLARIIVDRASKELEPFGIALIDVQLRRISYEKSVEEKVYLRMISERNRIAEKIRSIGKGEEAKIKGKINLELKQIQSEAYRKSQEVRGVAEAKSMEIYTAAMQKDPDFYEFQRTLEAYKKTMQANTSAIFSSDMAFLQTLHRSPSRR